MPPFHLVLLDVIVVALFGEE